MPNCWMTHLGRNPLGKWEYNQRAYCLRHLNLLLYKRALGELVREYGKCEKEGHNTQLPRYKDGNQVFRIWCWGRRDNSRERCEWKREIMKEQVANRGRAIKAKEVKAIPEPEQRCKWVNKGDRQHCTVHGKYLLKCNR